MNWYQFKTISNIDGILKLELLWCSKVILPWCDCILDDLTDEEKNLLARWWMMTILWSEKIIEPDLKNVSEEIKSLIQEKESKILTGEIEKAKEIDEIIVSLSDMVVASKTIDSEEKKLIDALLSSKTSWITESVKQ